ncbi:4'-phosphopantetheinyl transferase family protein [Streptomyces sp. G5(2025)]|uniref:4'-phosphopantetheinyl transferase family protein n=1 Tax=Streptomyces sp. G5(2025) TaxID=3406628 RepID=UPI003C154A15
MTEPSSRPRVVETWWARLADGHDGLVGMLDPVERARYEATLDSGDRRRFLLGCSMSRIGLGDRLGMPPGDVPLKRVCPRCGGPHGKVVLDLPATSPDTDLRFSVTHSGDTVGVAFGQGAEVGLDVEETDHMRNLKVLAPRVLSETERADLFGQPPAERPQAFLRYWTRKEAVLKCWGTGLHVPLHRLEVSAPERDPEVLGWPDQPDLPRDVRLIDMLVGGLHPATVCLSGSEDVMLLERDAGPVLRQHVAR